MGNTLDIVPTTVEVNCANAPADARTDYACATASQVRWGLTTLHLILMTAVYVFTLVVYLIYLQIRERRVSSQLRALPSKTLLARRDTLSRAMFRRIINDAAMISSEQFLLKPPSTNLIQAPRGWGTGVHEGVHFRTAIAQIAVEVDKLVTAVVPRSFRAQMQSHSLRLFAQHFERTHNVPVVLTLHLASACDKAIYLEDYEFTAEEYTRAVQAWKRFAAILSANPAAHEHNLPGSEPSTGPSTESPLQALPLGSASGSDVDVSMIHRDVR